MTSSEPIASQTLYERPLHRRFRPEESGESRSRVRAAVPLGLLGMLALVVTFESWVLRGGNRFVDHIGYSWAFSTRAATEKAPGRDVLCLGDSLVKHGLAPRVINEVTGRHSYNLATAAGPVPVTYAILRRALDSGARPAAIVFDLKPSMLIGGPRFSVRYFPQALTPLELLELCRADRSGAFGAELILGAVLPSFRSRHEIRGDLLAAIRGETGPLRGLNAVVERNWKMNDGANLATPQPDFDGEVSEAQHLQYLSRGFSAHRVNAEYARRLVALAEASGIRSYLLIPPLAPKLQERRTRTGADEKYARFLHSLQDRSPALTVLDARDSGYPHPAFVDPTHLDARGALALSADVADVLKRDLDQPFAPSPGKRWVQLPAYRERSLPADLEHVELSRARLGFAMSR